MRHNVSKEEGVQVIFPFDSFWKIYDPALEKTGRYSKNNTYNKKSGERLRT